MLCRPVGGCDLGLWSAVCGRSGHARGGRILHLGLVLAAGHVCHDFRQPFPGALFGAGVVDPLQLCLGGLAPRPRQRHGSGDEVFCPGGLGQWFLTLWFVHVVWRDRQFGIGRRVQGGRLGPDQTPSDGLGFGFCGVWPGLQARRGAVSHVGARCVSRCTHFGDLDDCWCT